RAQSTPGKPLTLRCLYGSAATRVRLALTTARRSTPMRESEAHMSDHWAFYPSNVENEPATFLVNLNVPEQLDIQLYRWRIGVTLSFESDRDDGFPANETADQLNDAEDR